MRGKRQFTAGGQMGGRYALGCLVGDLIEGRKDVVGKLNLGHRSAAV
jgi:hypothetical protein